MPSSSTPTSQSRAYRQRLSLLMVCLCIVVASLLPLEDFEEQVASVSLASQILGVQVVSKVDDTSLVISDRAVEGGLYSPWVLHELRSENQECRKKYDEAFLEEHLPGTPQLKKEREMLLMRARAEPMIFESAPSRQLSQSKGIRAQQDLLDRTAHPRDVSLRLLLKYRGNRKVLQELFLRDGYFYFENAGQAVALSRRVTLKKLFNSPRLELIRGAQSYEVYRDKKGSYRYSAGERKGQFARLLIFDRVRVLGENGPKTWGPSLHIDLRESQGRIGFDRLKPLFISADFLGAELTFTDLKEKALFRRHKSELILDCIWSEDDSFLQLGNALDLGHRRQAVLRVLRDAMVSQINMSLPFDEPRTEVGQQDGRLRREFMRAYFAKEKSYEFNEDTYDIFDRKGRVLSPQVCVDFITETFEYAAGLSWGKYGKKPTRDHGTINFDHLIEPSLRRQEQSLRAYAQNHPEQFKLKDIPRSDWIRYEKTKEFFSFLEANRNDFMPGDIVVIRGRAKWDDYAEVHTHTFFIYESDPVTGVPMLISGNAGRPRLLTWDTEMERAPKRSIRHRIRPNTEWLYDHVVIREPLLNARYSSPLTAQPN